MDSSGGLPEAPPGWTVSEEKGRLIYKTSHPVVKIHSVAVLKEYQKKGRYLDVDPSELIFSRKKMKAHKEKIVENMVNDGGVESDMETQNEDLKMEIVHPSEVGKVEKTAELVILDGEETVVYGSNRKLENEREKIRLAVEHLTIDTKKKVNHKEVLVKSAQKLNDIRVSQKHVIEGVELLNIQSRLCQARNENEIAEILWNIPAFRARFSTLTNSKYLEQLFRLATISESPLMKFPPDINANLYSDIIELALEHAPDFLLLIINLTVKHENPLDEKDAVKIAHLFAQFASSVSSKNSTLKKIKTICLKSNGLTNEGLDSLASVGGVETSRSFRNARDFLAGISDEILKSYARTMMAQFTFDNLDIQINHVMHHLTLNFLEFEQTATDHLSVADSLTFDQMKTLFSLDTVLMQSEQNSYLFEHYKVVVATTLGRFFGREIPEVEWLLSVFPKHYPHPNSVSACRKSLLHVDKPMYLQETKNSEMFKIMDTLQQEYLQLVGQQSANKEQFFKDLDVILSVESDPGMREEAEKRIHQEVLSAGEMICHGDYLTNIRFETCKRLKQGSVTAIERYDFMKMFRLGLFHLRMTKTIQDLECGMKNEVNLDDNLSLGWFRTVLGLNNISNREENIKRCGQFEYHDQFCLEIGSALLLSAFRTFLKSSSTPIKTQEGAVQFIMQFLDFADIKYFYDPTNYDEKDHFDDCLSSCKENASRTVLSMVTDYMEHEGDGLGLRAMRTIMIPYFLNKRKQQTSKYAPMLLLNKVYFMGASKRTQERVDLLACVNPTGEPGRNVARDEYNEHKVRACKECLRGLHSQLTDSNISKSMLGSNILSQLESHDKDSILNNHSGGKSSHSYFSVEERSKIKQEVEKVEPFNRNREKIEFFDKTRGSVFSGLAETDIQRFLDRNKKLFSRNDPHKFLKRQVQNLPVDV